MALEDSIVMKYASVTHGGIEEGARVKHHVYSKIISLQDIPPTIALRKFARKRKNSLKSRIGSTTSSFQYFNDVASTLRI